LNFVAQTPRSLAHSGRWISIVLPRSLNLGARLPRGLIKLWSLWKKTWESSIYSI